MEKKQQIIKVKKLQLKIYNKIGFVAWKSHI